MCLLAPGPKGVYNGGNNLGKEAKTVKCKNCTHDNLLKANYCRDCGTAFTQQEKDEARAASPVGKLEKFVNFGEKLEGVKEVLSLSFITDNFFVRLALLVLPVLAALIFGGEKVPNELMIKESSEYSIYQNTDTGEYFLDVNSDSISLQLYVPGDTRYVNIVFEGTDGSYRSENFELDSAIVLQTRGDGCYTVTAVNDDMPSLQLYTV